MYCGEREKQAWTKFSSIVKNVEKSRQRQWLVGRTLEMKFTFSDVIDLAGKGGENASDEI